MNESSSENAHPGVRKITDIESSIALRLKRDRRRAGRVVADSDIARRAYELYEQRGGEHGRDLDDWLQAERELRSALSSTAA